MGMTLSEYVLRYCLQHDVEPSTAEQYGIVAKQFDEFAQPLGETTEDDANRWIVHLIQVGLSRFTVKSRRGALGVLLRAAAEDRLIPPIRKLRNVRTPEQNPDAFTVEDLQKLMEATKKMRGKYPSGIRRSAWWQAFLPAKYDSGLRLSDMLQLEWTDLWPGGYIVLTQRKTANRHKVEFAKATLELMERIKPYGGRLIFPWSCHRRAFYKAFERLRERAGLPEGSSKWIRRAGATHVFQEYGLDAAQHFLGHKTPNLALQSYIDQRQTDEQTYRPREISWLP